MSRKEKRNKRKGKMKGKRGIGERLIKYSISSFVRLVDIPSLNMQRYTICLTDKEYIYIHIWNNEWKIKKKLDLRGLARFVN